MFAAILPLLSPVVGKLIDLIPDPAAREKARAEAEKDLLAVLMQADTQQVEVNKVEAAHSSIFVAGWRPFIGWVCGVALAYHFILQPLITWACHALGHYIALPEFDLGELTTILLGMLGLGGLRTFEKFKKVAK